MFDMTHTSPERPDIDRDAVALTLQRKLRRPLLWSEYCRVWNALTEYMGADDYLG